MSDFANNAAVAWVLSPLNLRNSDTTCSRENPKDINSFISDSVNLSLGNKFWVGSAGTCLPGAVDVVGPENKNYF